MGLVIGTVLGIAITVETALAAAAAIFSVVMTLTQKRPQMPSAARGQAERKQTLRSSAAATDWVYGNFVKAGLLTFAEEDVGGWQDENPDPEENQGFVEWLHMVITLCDHPVDRIGRIWLNDDEIQVLGENATYELWNNRTTADPFMLQNCPSWKNDMIGRGLAALRLSMLFSQKKFPAGVPNVKVEIFGRHVYDPRDRVMKWSDNAALVYLDFIRNHPKIKVPDSRIDWESFKRAASLCDEIVTRPDGKPEKRYTINGAFDMSERPLAIMDDMLIAMSAERTEFGGLHGLMVGAYYGGLPVTVESGQIISDIDITPEPAKRDRVNTINGTFIDPVQLFIETDFPQVRAEEWVQQDGEELKDDMKLRFVTSDYQAQRIANIQMRRKRLGRTLSFTMNASGYGIRQGMYIQLKVPQMGIDSEFRVVDWGFNPDDFTVAITVRQDGIEVWEDAIGQPMDRPPLTNLPSGIPAPSSLQYRTEVVGEVVQGVITWLNTAQVAYTNILIKRAGVLIYTAQEMRTIHRVQGLPVGDYSAELIAIGMNGAQSAISTIAFSIQLPPAVIGCDIRAGNWEIGLTPKLATTGSYGTQFEFYYSRVQIPIGEVIAKAQKLGSGTQITHSGLQPDTVHYYWIRAINAYGQGPLFALEAKTTKDVNSVLDIISGQIGAEDLIEELRAPLTETIDMWTAKVGNTDIGKYGGIGLTIEEDPDGVWRVKCIVDAQVFAILDPSGATGANSRHPFVVKDGVVYMNKLLLDDAEIGSVIAKYINVQHLVGVLIEAGTIKSSDNGQSFQLLPDGTLTARKANITGAITATSGSFTGTVNANAGTMNNITIAENCNVLGTIYANRIVGDVTRAYVLSGMSGGRNSNRSVSVNIPPVGRSSYISIACISASISTQYDDTISATVRLNMGGTVSSMYINGRNGVCKTFSASKVIPANTAQTVIAELFVGDGGNGSTVETPQIVVFHHF